MNHNPDETSLCIHDQPIYFCSRCNPMNVEALDAINPTLFAPAAPVKTWTEQFPSGTRSVAQQKIADEQAAILARQPEEYKVSAEIMSPMTHKEAISAIKLVNMLDDVPFGTRKDSE